MIAEKQENLQALETNIAAQQGEVQSKVDKLDAEIASGVAAKEATVKGLPASLIKRYARLRDQRKGIGSRRSKGWLLSGLQHESAAAALQHSIPCRRSHHLSSLSEDPDSSSGHRRS